MAAEVVNNGPYLLNFNQYRPSAYDPGLSHPDLIPRPMDRHERHARDTSRSHDAYTKPQLPSFDHFVTGAGHPDLAFRGENKSSSSNSQNHRSPAFETKTLSRATAVESPRQWDEYNKQAQPFEPSERHDSGSFHHATNGIHRRSSLVLPTSMNREPKISRSYSSNTTRPDIDSSPVWPQPRIHHEEHIPGKGLCYVFDDGSTCPKTIGGDTVNPKWGTTKAGKPRKRLGQACNTCREKKIKCDPSFPKCSQCQKFNRECKFEAPTRSSTNKSPRMRNNGTSPTSIGIPEEYSDTRRSSIAPTEASTPVEQIYYAQTKSSLSVDELLSPDSQARNEARDFQTPSKRQRVAAGYVRRDTNSDDIDMQDAISETEQTGFGLDVDPVIVAEKIVLHYMTIYVQLVNISTFEIFPQGYLFDWVRNDRKKKTQDLIMLYALLALAACYATNPERVEHRAIFSAIAHRGLRDCTSKVKLQMVQASLLLSLCDFAQGKTDDAYITFGIATCGAAYLQLNVEPSDTLPEENLYGLSPAQQRECRRRTFWAVYCADLHDGTFQGHSVSFAAPDVFLRLPCASELYEKDNIPDVPFFDVENVVGKLLLETQHDQISTMAYLVQLATICSDIRVATYRSELCYRFGREMPDYRILVQKAESRLQAWEQGYLRITRSRKKDDPSSSWLSKQAGLEIVYHYAHMKLNRHIYHSRLTDKEIATHARKAHQHAFKILHIAQQLISTGGHDMLDHTFATTSPLVGFAIGTAIDIVTAAGTIHEVVQPQSRTMQLMYKGIELLDQLSQVWHTATLQHAIAKKRCLTVFSTATQVMMERKIAFYCSDPMMPAPSRELDIIYGTDRQKYLNIFGWIEGVTKNDEIHRIHTKPTSTAQPT